MSDESHEAAMAALGEQAAAAHEQFVADMQALDLNYYEWRRAVRAATLSRSGFTLADIAELRTPFDSYIDEQIQREVNRARSGERVASGS